MMRLEAEEITGDNSMDDIEPSELQQYLGYLEEKYDVEDISTSASTEGNEVWERMRHIREEIITLENEKLQIQDEHSKSEDTDETVVNIVKETDAGEIEILKKKVIILEPEQEKSMNIEECNKKIQKCLDELDTLKSRLEELGEVPTIDDFKNVIIPSDKEEWNTAINQYTTAKRIVENNFKADISTFSFSGDPMPTDINSVWNGLKSVMNMRGYYVTKRINNKDYKMYCLELTDNGTTKSRQNFANSKEDISRVVYTNNTGFSADNLLKTVFKEAITAGVGSYANYLFPGSGYIAGPIFSYMFDELLKSMNANRTNIQISNEKTYLTDVSLNFDVKFVYIARNPNSPTTSIYDLIATADRTRVNVKHTVKYYYSDCSGRTRTENNSKSYNYDLNGRFCSAENDAIANYVEKKESSSAFIDLRLKDLEYDGKENNNKNIFTQVRVNLYKYPVDIITMSW